MANPYTMDLSSQGKAWQGLGKLAGSYLQGQEQEQQAAQAEQQRQATIQEGMAAFEANDPYALAEFSLNNPQMGQMLNQYMGVQSEQQKQQKMDFVSKVLTTQDSAKVPGLFDEHIAQIEGRGGDASNAIKQKSEYMENPEAGMKELEGYYITQDPKNANALIEYRQRAGLSKTPVDQPEVMSEYQSESIDLRKSQQDLDLLKLERQGETNEIQKKKLNNEIKIQEQKIRDTDLKAKALAAGPTTQKILAKSSEAQKKASSFAQRMTISAGELNTLAESVDERSRVIPLIAGGGGVVSETANRMASPEEQQYASAASDFVTAQLRKESGAVIGEGEFKRKYREFFPMPGDSDKQVEAKRKRRERASDSMRKESGGLYEALYKKETQPATQEQQQYSEGMTATNPKTGEVMVFRNGSWGAQ